MPRLPWSTLALVALFAGSAGLAGCSSNPLAPLNPPGERSGTYPGNHEAIAWCLGDMASRSKAGPPAQKIDKATKVTTLTRDGQYVITLSQIGSRVQAVGRRLPGGGDALDFVWPHIDQCAAQLSSP